MGERFVPKSQATVDRAIRLATVRDGWVSSHLGLFNDAPSWRSHGMRASYIAGKLAMHEKDLSPRDVLTVMEATVYHDLGKVFAPPHVQDLLNSTKHPLSKIELEEVNGHVGISVDYVKSFQPNDPRVLDIIAHHHDRDFPKPIEPWYTNEDRLMVKLETILACADQTDVLLSNDRNYKGRRTVAKTLKVLVPQFGEEMSKLAVAARLRIAC